MRRTAGWTAVAVAAAVTMMIAGVGPAFAAGKEAPEFGTWQYWEAVESGNIPSPDGPKGIEQRADRLKGFEKVELGGVDFRLGLDTP